MDKYEKERQYMIDMTRAVTKDGITIGICPNCKNVSLCIADEAAYCPCCNNMLSMEYLRWKYVEPGSTNLPIVSAGEEKRQLYKLMREAQWLYAGWLKTSKRALEYANDRGLDETAIVNFGIGYGDCIYDKVKDRYPESVLLKSGLFFRNENGDMKERFYHRLIIPIADINGRVIGFGGRLIHPQKKKAKYINSPESCIFDKGSNLYGMYVAKRYAQNGVILCEGYMDAITLHKAGFKSSIASLGTALTPQQAFLIRTFTNRVYLAYDSDTAGIKAAVKGISLLRGAGITDIRLVNMKPYKDPDEFLQHKGRNEFIKRISTATRDYIYMSAFYVYQYKEKKMAEDEMYQKIAETLLRTDSNVIHKVAMKHRLNEGFLRYEVNKIKTIGDLYRIQNTW